MNPAPIFSLAVFAAAGIAARGECEQSTPAELVGQRREFDDVAIRRARRTDPETSHTAAANAAKFASSHAGRILAAVERLGTATAHEIAVDTGLSVVQVDRRRKEMEQAGLVYMLRQDGKLFTRDGFMVWAKVGA